jgi:hypothetical protein
LIVFVLAVGWTRRVAAAVAEGGYAHAPAGSVGWDEKVVGLDRGRTAGGGRDEHMPAWPGPATPALHASSRRELAINSWGKKSGVVWWLSWDLGAHLHDCLSARSRGRRRRPCMSMAGRPAGRQDFLNA